MVSWNLFHHGHRRRTLRHAVGGKHFRVHDQPVAVLGQQVPVITQLGFLAAAFAREQRVSIGGGFVGLVAPFLTVKVYRRIARIVRRLVVFIFPLEAL